MGNYDYGYLDRKFINKVLENNGFEPRSKGYELWAELLAAGISQTEPFLQKHYTLCLYLANKLGYPSPEVVDLNLLRWRGEAKRKYGNKQLYNLLVHEVLEMEALELEDKLKATHQFRY